MLTLVRRWLAAGALCTAIVGCGGKSEDKPAPVIEPAKPPPVAPPVAPPVPAEAGSAAALKPSATSNDLAYLPTDSEVVVGLELSRLTTSAVWKQLVVPLLLEGDIKAKLAELQARCGFDPIASIKTISFGARDLDAKVSGVAVVRGADKAKVVACFDKLKADPKAKLTIAQDGEITNLTSKGGDTVAVAFTDPTTAIVAFGPAAASIKTAMTGTSQLPKAAAFVAVLNQTNTQDPVWAVINGDAKLLAPVRAIANLKVVFGSLAVAEGVALEVRARFESADKATQLATFAKNQSGMLLRAFTFDKLVIEADGPDVKLTAAASSENLQAIIKQIKTMQSGQTK
ncbi:MAG: hypothetical protein ABI867_06730 [Kofleriaceae bacterium]